MMRQASRTELRGRRGAALLIVLAVIVLTTSSLAVIARLTATAGLARTTARDAMIAAEMLEAAGQPLGQWLREKAPGVVLPPEAGSPRVAVRSDRWTLDGVDFEISIVAFDQCGMVPLNALDGSSPLGSALGDLDVEGLRKVARAERGTVAGLDMAGPGVFPDREPGTLRAGELVATHGAAPPRINVNTAPMALVESAMKRAGRGGVDAIAAARAAGTPAVLPAAPGSARRARGGAAPQLVTASDAWAFRIDVRVGGLVRSWWCVYVRAGNGKPWECVQRLAILD